jgi:hypothetical protein
MTKTSRITSQMIVEFLCSAIIKGELKYNLTKNLENDIKFLHDKSNEISFLIKKRFDVELIIKTDSILKVINTIFLKNILKKSEGKWNKEYVRANYSFSCYGRDSIYYPSNDPKRLLVHFSSMGKDRFDRYSRFFDFSEMWNESSAHLFLKDDNFSFFLGNDDSPLTLTYSKIIKQFALMNNLELNKVFTIGGSMGGYAALYYTSLLNLNGAIVVAPQVNKLALEAHKFDNWRTHVSNTGNQFRELDFFMLRKDNSPNIYIEYGNYKADQIAAENLLNSIKDLPGLRVIRKANWSKHSIDDYLSLKTILSTIQYFEDNGFAS